MKKIPLKLYKEFVEENGLKGKLEKWAKSRLKSDNAKPKIGDAWREVTLIGLARSIKAVLKHGSMMAQITRHVSELSSILYGQRSATRSRSKTSISMSSIGSRSATERNTTTSYLAQSKKIEIVTNSGFTRALNFLMFCT